MIGIWSTNALGLQVRSLKHGEPSTMVVAADDVCRAQDRIPASGRLSDVGHSQRVQGTYVVECRVCILT